MSTEPKQATPKAWWRLSTLPECSPAILKTVIYSRPCNRTPQALEARRIPQGRVHWSRVAKSCRAIAKCTASASADPRGVLLNGMSK